MNLYNEKIVGQMHNKNVQVILGTSVTTPALTSLIQKSLSDPFLWLGAAVLFIAIIVVLAERARNKKLNVSKKSPTSEHISFAEGNTATDSPDQSQPSRASKHDPPTSSDDQPPIRDVSSTESKISSKIIDNNTATDSPDKSPPDHVSKPEPPTSGDDQSLSIDAPITTSKISSKIIKDKRSALILICIVIGIILFFAIDLDGDGLSTITELRIGTSVNNPDSDGDGLIDGLEVKTYMTDPLAKDTDGDGLDDSMEVNTYQTNPLSTDSDGDGFNDYDEVCIYKTDPNIRTLSIISVTTTPISGDVFINGEYVGTGIASKEYSPGSYTITFGSVTNYHSPDPQRVTLEPGDSLSIVGTYTAFSPACLKITDVYQTVSGISPSIYKFMSYKDEPLFRISVTNIGEIKADRVHLSSKLDGVTDWQTKTVKNIEPNAVTTVDILPAMSGDVLTKFSEDTSETATFKIEYRSTGVEQTPTHTSRTIKIYNKNAIPLSDASRLASDYSIPSYCYFYSYYITSTNEDIRGFATSVAAGKSTAEEKAKAIFDELGRLGLKHEKDGSNPFGVRIDYVQFPSRTLEMKRGDCDDIAVLYASLLESIDIKTELICIPQHVFVGYEYTDGGWHLVETTMIHAPDSILGIEYNSYFDEASAKGYEEWVANKESAVIVETRNAWELGIRR